MYLITIEKHWTKQKLLKLDYVIPAQNFLGIPPFTHSMVKVLTARVYIHLHISLVSFSASRASMKAPKHGCPTGASEHCPSVSSDKNLLSRQYLCGSSPHPLHKPPRGLFFSSWLQMPLPWHSLSPSHTSLTSSKLRIFSHALRLTYCKYCRLALPSRMSSTRTAIFASSFMAISPELEKWPAHTRWSTNTCRMSVLGAGHEFC